MPTTMIGTYGADAKASLFYARGGASLEYGPLSTAVVNTKTVNVDLWEIAELIGAPVGYARMAIRGGSSAPSTAVTTLRGSIDGVTFYNTSSSVTGVSSASPDLRDVRGFRYIDAAITTAEASDDVYVLIALYPEGAL